MKALNFFREVVLGRTAFCNFTACPAATRDIDLWRGQGRRGEVDLVVALVVVNFLKEGARSRVLCSQNLGSDATPGLI
jgi:hypothetical protein